MTHLPYPFNDTDPEAAREARRKALRATVEKCKAERDTALSQFDFLEKRASTLDRAARDWQALAEEKGKECDTLRQNLRFHKDRADVLAAHLQKTRHEASDKDDEIESLRETLREIHDSREEDEGKSAALDRVGQLEIGIAEIHAEAAGLRAERDAARAEASNLRRVAASMHGELVASRNQVFAVRMILDCVRESMEQTGAVARSAASEPSPVSTPA